MSISWVVGARGLVGSALCRRLRLSGTPMFELPEPLQWTLADRVDSQLVDAVHAFSDRSRKNSNWEVYWAAGVGAMGSSEADLAPETLVLARLLNLIALDPVLSSMPGGFVFSSSAGAIYAGSRDEIISEETSPAPTTPYAREKLKQEALVAEFASRCNAAYVFIARITTVYGVGQSIGKQQGLLAHMARCMLRNQPIQIYVPFDTIRDYITSDDAAAAVVAVARDRHDRPRVLTKIIASERPTTIAEIVSVYKRVARRTPRVVTSASKLSSLYSRRVQFRSVVARNCMPTERTSLLVGVSQLMAAERSNFARGAAQDCR